MRNKVVINGDIANIRCECMGEEVWIKVDACYLDLITKEFLSIGVYRLRSTGNSLLAGEYKKMSEDSKEYRLHLLHRFLLNAGEGEVVSFKDGDGTNCTMDNMELMTKSESVRRSMVGAMSKTSRYYPGVHRTAATGRFTARIKVKGKVIHLGTFETVANAIDARKQAEREYWGW